MEDIKYPIELEVVTPLSVGAGNDNEWTRGIDFVQKDGKVYVIDIQKAVANGIDIDRLTQLFLRSDEEGISQLLGNKIDKVSKFIFKSPVKTTNAIKAFLRTELFDKPIVAGSSLKGSIRSALFNYLRTDEKKNEEVFGNMKDGTDLMRFIRVADIEMPSTVLVNTKINPKAQYSAEYLSAQYLLKCESYPEFLDYDSYVDCGELFSIPIERLKQGEFFGFLNDEDRKEIFNLLETSDIFSTKQKKRYGIRRR